ncbi:hypothetical protein QBC37DRAFT_466603 [Rhypophila decipiens]|uniref:Uncharacterized protein n=1 Tax=Rhypophila decipiens TaxID=261697 RepID=A0AAN6Y9S7_9PEZI|nr:hypothetical protein QBC37DRAFT_466603 [Rhypophila decipiens]
MPAIKNEVEAEVVELPGLVTIDDSLIEKWWAEEQENGDAPAELAAWDTVNGDPKYNEVLHRNDWGKRELCPHMPNLPLSSRITVSRYALENAAESCDEVMGLYNKMGAMMVRAEIEFAQQMDKMRMFQQKLISARGETVSIMSDHMRTVMDWEDEVKRVKREPEEDKDEAEEGPGAKKPRYHELVDKFAAEGRREGRYEVNPILTRLDPQF